MQANWKLKTSWEPNSKVQSLNKCQNSWSGLHQFKVLKAWICLPRLSSTTFHLLTVHGACIKIKLHPTRSLQSSLSASMELEDQFNFTVDSLELLAAEMCKGGYLCVCVCSSVLETEVRTCGYLQRSIENSKIIDIDVKSVVPWCAGDYKPGKSMTRCHYLSKCLPPNHWDSAIGTHRSLWLAASLQRQNLSS